MLSAVKPFALACCRQLRSHNSFVRQAANRAQQVPLHLGFELEYSRKRVAPAAFAEDGTMTLNKRIGFMGAGQMAEALARGLIDKGVVSASQICCSDPAGTRKQLFRDLGATPYDTNLEVRTVTAAARHSNAAIVPQQGLLVQQPNIVVMRLFLRDLVCVAVSLLC